MVQNHLNRLSTFFRQKASFEICWIWSSRFREEDVYRFHDSIPVNSLGARADNPKLKRFTTLIIHCKFQHILKKKKKKKKKKKTHTHKKKTKLFNFSIIQVYRDATFSLYKSIETPIWPYRKKVNGQPTTIIWTNLEELEKTMLWYQYSASKPSWFWRRGILSVLPYVDMEAILFNGTKPFEQNGYTLSTEGPMLNLVKVDRAVLEKTFKKFTILYMYIAKEQGQITLRGHNFDYN